MTEIHPIGEILLEVLIRIFNRCGFDSHLFCHVNHNVEDNLLVLKLHFFISNSTVLIFETVNRNLSNKKLILNKPKPPKPLI